MSLNTIILCGLVYCFSFTNAVQVTVSEGILEGSTLQTVLYNVTYYSFKGIPYAKPPVSELRFMPPQPPESWTGVRNATEHGSVCPQFNILLDSYVNGSEDCLFLNVYTPDINPTVLYPVVLYIHGGGFKSGSGNSDNYGPDFLIEKGVTVVTINYRLDALGLLCLDNEVVPGNNALKDQVMALKWVNNNIKYFGGDPSRITIMGQSAGSTSVALHLISPMSKGLFQRAICMSGSPTSEFTISYKPSKRAYKLGQLLGKDTQNATELLQFLQSVPTMDLINKNAFTLSSDEVGTANAFKYYAFLPVTEKDFGGEHFLTVNPLEAYKNADVHEADVMFGVTSEEGVTGIFTFVDTVIEQTAGFPEMLAPKQILYNSAPDATFDVVEQIREHYFGNETISVENMRAFVTFATETYITISVQRFFSYLPSSIGRRYSYVLSSYSGRNNYGVQGVPYGIYGTGHNDDWYYLFEPHSLNLTINLNSIEHKFVNLTTTVFSNFMKYGNPTPDCSLPHWPEYDPVDKHYANIANDTLIIGSDYIGDTVAFYEGLFKSTGTEF